METFIRLEVEADYREVEELTREAFWNIHVPGCTEHYLVHLLRPHPDFIPGLDFVATLQDKIVGNIMYTKSHLVDDFNNRLATTTFGPISVLPGYQRQGIGSALIRHSVPLAREMGCNAIIIYGHPENYCKHGFKGSKDYNITDAAGRYPYSLLVLELEKGLLNGQKMRFIESDAFAFDENAAAEFDRLFKPKLKEYQYSQEEFHLASRAFVE